MGRANRLILRWVPAFRTTSRICSISAVRRSGRSRRRAGRPDTRAHKELACFHSFVGRHDMRVRPVWSGRSSVPSVRRARTDAGRRARTAGGCTYARYVIITDRPFGTRKPFQWVQRSRQTNHARTSDGTDERSLTHQRPTLRLYTDNTQRVDRLNLHPALDRLAREQL